MSFIATFLVLSALGVVNAGHMLVKHHRQEQLVCPINHDCNVVTKSRWAEMLGVRNELLGVVFFSALFLALLVLLSYPAWSALIGKLVFGAVLIGFLYSLFLLYLQALVIKNFCLYCIASAIIATLLFINSFALLA